MDKICWYCGQPFISRRSTGQFCKPAHRVAYHRERLDAERRARSIEWEIQQLVRIAKKRPEFAVSSRLVDVLSAARKALQEAANVELENTHTQRKLNL